MFTSGGFSGCCGRLVYRAFARRCLTRVRETPRRIAPRLTEQDPLAAAGAMVFDCRPQVLPVAIDVSGTELAEIRSMTRARVATATPPEREQSFGGGGGDLLGSICPELGVDPGTDCEDELPILAGPPADIDQGMDSELQKVFIDVVSLPTMVTPVSDMDGALRAPQVECPVIAPPAVSAFVIRPSMATSSAGTKLLSPILSPPSPASVGVSPVPRTSPVVAVPEDFMLFNAAVTNQTPPETSSSSMGDVAGGLLPAIPMTPGQATASHPGVKLDAVGGLSEVADWSREAPFDIHQDHPRSVVSPQLLQDTQGCLFRMTSYDVESDGPNFAPEHGVQLHDPRLLEYVGAPESAPLTSRSPEYWVHHMGREKALSAALQLKHDAGLSNILSNVLVLQQLVTSLKQSAPCGALHDGNGSVAPTSRYGDTNAPAVSRVQCLHVMSGLLPGSAYVSREAK